MNKFLLRGQNFDLLLLYQCLLAIAAIFTFYANSDIYLSGIGIAPAPKNIVILFGVAAAPLLFSATSRINYISFPLVIWCAGYILLSLLSYCLFLPAGVLDAVARQEVESRVLAVLFILITMLIFSQHQIVHFWSRTATLVAVLFGICTNVYEFFNPEYFKLLLSDIQETSGRSAGFYIDANQSGYALNLGMIFAVGVLPPKYRVPFVFISGAGIFLTFSRGAILVWILLVAILILKRVILRSQLLSWGIGLGMVMIGLVATSSSILDVDKLQAEGLLSEDTRARLEWAEKPVTSEESASGRLQVVKMAWQMFLQNPFLGNGIGSVLELSIGYSTHNMYVYFMTDHGIIGALILPSLIYAVVRHARGDSKYISFAFIPLILFWGFFSHTLARDRFALIMFSLLSCMSTTSQIEQQSKVGLKS